VTSGVIAIENPIILISPHRCRVLDKVDIASFGKITIVVHVEAFRCADIAVLE
jgi:hypothetical protein